MALWMIAAIMADNFEVTGFRLLGTEKNEVKDVTIESTIKAIKAGIEIQNLVMSDNVMRVGKIECTMGDFKDYPAMDSDKNLIINTSTATVLDRYDVDKYTLCDGLGRVEIVSLSTIVSTLKLSNAYMLGDRLFQKKMPKTEFEPGRMLKKKANAERAASMTNLFLADKPYEIDENGVLICVAPAKKVRIPDGVKRIKIDAFKVKKANMVIEDIKLPDTIEMLEARQFSDIVNLTHIGFGNGIKEIPPNVLSGCNKISTITIPASVVIVRNRAFNKCKALETIYRRAGMTDFELGAYDIGVRLVKY